MKSTKHFCIIVLIFNMVFLTGCCNYQEVENIAMVSGFAVDKGENGKKYHLTFEFLDLSTETPQSKLLESDGDTLFDAIRNCISKSEKKMFFCHSKVIVISKEIAEEGISQILDLMFRDSELRLTTNLIISKAESAAEIINQKPVTDQLICMEITKSLEQNSTDLSKNPDVNLYQAYNMLSNDGLSLILPTIKITKNQKESIIQLDGTAVFKKDKLQGCLDKEETKYLLFIKNQISGGLITINDKSSEPNTSLQILYNETKIKPVISNNNLTMNIDLTTKVVWAENQSGESDMQQKRIKEIENETKKNLENNLSKVIYKVQKEYNSDIFGFGSTVSKYKPDYWNTAKKNWNKLFPNLKYKISSNVQVVNTACIKTKVEIGDIG